MKLFIIYSNPDPHMDSQENLVLPVRSLPSLLSLSSYHIFFSYGFTYLGCLLPLSVNKQ